MLGALEASGCELVTGALRRLDLDDPKKKTHRQGIQTLEQIRIIIEEAHVPVVVDAGIGVPSDAALAMELGADAVLVNTAVAQAKDPALMAEAIREGVDAGRKAYLAGRMPKRAEASPSSPTEGGSRPS